MIAASAGNHGMAVAYHSRRLNIAATIVMPLSAPLIKVTRVRQYGAEGMLHGSDYDGAYAEAMRLESREHGLLLSPRSTIHGSSPARAPSVSSSTNKIPISTRSSCRWAAAV